MIAFKDLPFTSVLFKEKNITLLFAILAIIFIGFAIIGGVINYSPVPYWDMWDGYLVFFSEISEGNFSEWWAQHNEHRIILSRVLFWVDISYFQGYGWFLIVVNYFLLGIVYLFFLMLIKERIVNKADSYFLNIFSFLSLILLFSWIQKDNLIWGFQNQFILAQLLPLISFYLLHKSSTSFFRSFHFFLLACLIGVLSLGSMASGLLTLPLMILFAVVLRMNLLRIISLALLTIITTVLYFYDYHSPVGHGSLKDALYNNPIGLIQYLLIYIGGPFNYFAVIGNQILALIAGIFLIASSIYFAWTSLKKPYSSSLQLALLFFILYVGGTALGSGGGRLIFGVDQALSSRYQTPALMAWIALLILYAPAINRIIKKSYIIVMPFILIPLLLLPYQFEALETQNNKLFERWIAAVSLQFGIKDQEQITSVFPSAEWALSISRFPVQQNLSIFGHPLIKDVNELIGQSIANQPTSQCLGSLDELSNIEDINKYARIRGWLFQTDIEVPPKLIHILNKNRKIIGYALTGQVRPDVQKKVNQKAELSGFKGYILANELGQNLLLKGYQPDCELKVRTPFAAYTINPPVSKKNNSHTIESNFK